MSDLLAHLRICIQDLDAIKVKYSRRLRGFGFGFGAKGLGLRVLGFAFGLGEPWALGVRLAVCLKQGIRSIQRCTIDIYLDRVSFGVSWWVISRIRSYNWRFMGLSS